MKRLLKWVAIVVAIPLVLAALHVLVYWSDWKRVPKIISAYSAKEGCTCLYVLERDQAFCRELVRQYLPISSFADDRERKEVRVHGLWRDSRAQYLGPREGCRLVE